MKYLLSTMLMLLVLCFCKAQDSISIVFHPSQYSVSEGINNDIEITKFQYYLSNIELLSKDSIVLYTSDSYILMDKMEQEISFVRSYKDFAFIRFNLGVDSTTNVSGAQGGVLDPIHGMYWTWQNGYINFKMEGSSPDCPTRKQHFNFHLGGYQGDYATIQTVIISIENNDKIDISFDLVHFLNEMDLKIDHTVMSTGRRAFQLSELAASSFKVIKR